MFAGLLYSPKKSTKEEVEQRVKETRRSSLLFHQNLNLVYFNYNLDSLKHLMNYFSHQIRQRTIVNKYAWCYSQNCRVYNSFFRRHLHSRKFICKILNRVDFKNNSASNLFCSTLNKKLKDQHIIIYPILPSQ